MLAVDGLAVTYEHAAPALRGVSLAVDPGGAVSVVGPNGAGKSSLLRAVSGMLLAHGGRVAAGSVHLEGRELTRRRPWVRVRRGVAHVLEGRQVFTALTVEENLRAGAHTRRRRDVGPAIGEVLALFPELVDRRDLAAGLLSGGEQQLLAIGRALMSGPRYLLLDEPTLGLAPRAVERVTELVAEVRRRGTAVLLAEHDPVLSTALDAEVHVLGGGRVLFTGPARAVAGDPRLAAAYLGTAR